MEEIWKDVCGYEGKYQVSNLGNVKSLNYRHTSKERILKPCKDRWGYLFVYLCRNGERKMYLVHRLVLMTFSPCENSHELQVNHIDENKLNNRLENLEWCNSLYNLTYNDRHKKIGEKNTNGKKSIPVVQINSSTNKVVNIWKSSMDAERIGGYKQTHITQCCKNKYLREGNNIYKDFRWCYLYEYISKIDPRIKKVILFGKEYYFNN